MQTVSPALPSSRSSPNQGDFVRKRGVYLRVSSQHLYVVRDRLGFHFEVERLIERAYRLFKPFRLNWRQSFAVSFDGYAFPDQHHKWNRRPIRNIHLRIIRRTVVGDAWKIERAITASREPSTAGEPDFFSHVVPNDSRFVVKIGDIES